MEAISFDPAHHGTGPFNHFTTGCGPCLTSRHRGAMWRGAISGTYHRGFPFWKIGKRLSTLPTANMESITWLMDFVRKIIMPAYLVGWSAISGSKFDIFKKENVFFISDTVAQTVSGSSPSGHLFPPMGVLLQRKWDGRAAHIKAACLKGIRLLSKYLLPLQRAPAEPEATTCAMLAPWVLSQQTFPGRHDWVHGKKNLNTCFQREVRWPLETHWETLATH